MKLNGKHTDHHNVNRYFFNNRLHKEDGPSIEFPFGAKRWFYNGKEIFCKDNEEFLKIIKLIAFL